MSPRAAVTAPFSRRLLTVTGMRDLGEAYRVLTVADPAGPSPVPGQFAMIAAAQRWGGGEDERPYLARAFSIARWREGECEFLLEDVGPGTRRLCELRPGEQLWAVGPLGVGFTAPAQGRRAILVGGGVGIAPLALLKDELRGAPEGLRVDALLGFRDGVRAHGSELLPGARVASDDGSAGHHGAVTDLLAAELARDAHAVVYACGPSGMLEGVRVMCAAHATPAQLALEAPMACGFGACFGCVVPRRGGGYLRVCVEGPVVDAGELECVEHHAGRAPAGQPA